MMPCKSTPACGKEACLLQGLMTRLNREVKEYFQETTLAVSAERLRLGDKRRPGAEGQAQSGNA